MVLLHSSSARALGGKTFVLDNLPNARSIFDASIESIGGMHGVAGINSIAGIADCTSPNGSYITELYSARGDKLYFKQVRADRVPFIAVVNGLYGWAIHPETQQVERLDSRTAAMILDHDLLMLPLVLTQRFKNPVVHGVTDLAQTPCVRMQATDNGGLPCELYFATDTHRLAGMILTNPIGNEGEMVRIIFAEWRPIDRILLPSTVVITDRSGDFRFVFRNPSLNSVDEAMFLVPNEITTLS